MNGIKIKSKTVNAKKYDCSNSRKGSQSLDSTCSTRQEKAYLTSRIISVLTRHPLRNRIERVEIERRVNRGNSNP